jgi:quercetin dioxygenase-like cupin family protein
MRRTIVIAIALLSCIGWLESLESRTPQIANAVDGHLVVAPDALKWQPLPPTWADGPPPPGFTMGQTEVAFIQGDPNKEGASFVFRLRSTPGTQLPPHWHETDEHITVMSGTWCVGMGDKFDANACRNMGAGAYIFLPKGMRHFAIAKGDVVQIHGIGPFKIHWVK